MTRPYDMMTAGHLCLDIIPRFTDTGAREIQSVMRPGKLVNVQDAAVSTGGIVSNTGITVKNLGGKVCFCACVGDDCFGKLTIDILRKTGNADGIQTRQGQASSYTIVVAPPGIDRIFLHNTGTNDVFSADDLDPDLIAQCRHFHFGYPPLMANMFANDGDDLQKVFEVAKAAGATTSCDMTPPDPDSPSGKAPWRTILEKVLPFVDIFVPSIEEAVYMLNPEMFMRMKREHHNADLVDHLGPADYSNLADEILAMGSKMTTLKSGHRGFYMKTGSRESFESLGAAKPGDADNWADRELWAPAFEPGSFGSATGAGDASIAGLLCAYLRGLPIEDALRYAACCGMQNVRVLDAVSGIRSWDETTAMLREDLPIIDPQLGNVWSHVANHKLWAGPKDRA